ncbi:MAG: AI-2E family transporter, partial [Actinobacteria bacterium]|nr:AI-2E family transporter [Actinomycetota bacterium]
MRPKKPLKNIEAIRKIGIYSWSLIGLLIIVALFFYVLFRIRIAIIPLILAMGIAYLVSPLVVWMSKKMKRVFAIIIAYIIFAGFFFTLFFFTIPMIVDQFNIFIIKFPEYIKNLTEIFNRFIETSRIIAAIEGSTGRDILPLDSNAITTYIINTFGVSSANFLQNMTSFTRSFINIVITIIIGPVLSIYILKDSGRLRNLFIK